MRLKLPTKAVTICRLFESHQLREIHQRIKIHQLIESHQPDRKNQRMENLPVISRQVQ